jgi:hypothetical protein
MATSLADVAHDDRSSPLYKSRKLAQNCHNNLKNKERVGKKKRVRGRSSEVLLVLLFILDISLISTLLVPVFRCNESVISIDSLDFFRFVV